MKILSSEFVVCVDVDNTLAMHTNVGQQAGVPVLDPYDNAPMLVYPNEDHIKLMIRLKNRGVTIIVWSASGVKWAESVIKAFNLEKYVDFVSSKPMFYVDDKDCQEWMGQRLFIKGGWGN